MPGAWEIQANNRVLCGILHTEAVTMSWALPFKYLQIPGPVIPVTGMPFDHARNHLCALALEKGYEYIFFLDSDVVPPSDAVFRLMNHRLPIVSGMYCRRSIPAGVPVMQKPAGQWITNFTLGSMVEVDVVGAGCLLIHRTILERMHPLIPKENPRKWFEWMVDYGGMKEREECMSEDFEFCRRVRKLLKEKIWVDTSIQCRHIGNGEAAYASFNPLGAIQVA